MDCMNLWLQLGLPLHVRYTGSATPRRVKGAFSLSGKAGDEPKRVAKKKEGTAKEGVPLLCKDCGKEPRKVSDTSTTYSYCRACDTQRMRVYRARKKREQSEKT